MTTQDKITQYRNLEVQISAVLSSGGGKLPQDTKDAYRKLLHDARIKRLTLQLDMISNNKKIDKIKEQINEENDHNTALNEAKESFLA